MIFCRCREVVQNQQAEPEYTSLVDSEHFPRFERGGGKNMEWIQAVSQLFSSLGVPVACLAVTFYLWYRETENHKEEIHNLTEVLNNNTMAIQKLADKLDVKE